MKLSEQVAGATARLGRAGVSATTAGLDAELLARHVLGWNRARYLAERDGGVSATFAERYEALVSRRERREPIALITGTREFWGLEFEVTRDVLIPRPETELIIEAALALSRRGRLSPRTIVDAGTGSGCLAVTLARLFPDASVIATDLSAAALKVARLNAARHDVGDRVTWLQGNFLDGLRGPVDLVVSNPPYVPEPALPALQPEVRDYEPALALLAGPDGLDAIRELVAQAESVLRPGGWLILEFGYGQEASVGAAVRAHPVLALESVLSDLQGISRTAVVQRGHSPVR